MDGLSELARLLAQATVCAALIAREAVKLVLLLGRMTRLRLGGPPMPPYMGPERRARRIWLVRPPGPEK